MGFSYHERLSALDSSFLDIEDDNVHMHIGAVGIFEGGPLLSSGGGIDMGRIRALAHWGLQRAPRFRQRIMRVPILEHPVWVDDPNFNIEYHVRHTRLPEPGDERQLKRLAGRIMSQKLDHSRPLWEMWFVEGLEKERFAIISKIHHCMSDGVSSVQLMGALMGPNPYFEPGPVEGPWLPSPAPSPAKLLRDELSRRVSAPWKLMGPSLRALTHPRESVGEIAESVSGTLQTLYEGLSGATSTPLNQPIGPYRRFDWTRFDLAAVKEVKKRLGGTVNDVVLATVAGAMRRFLQERGLDVDGLDFRAMLPVNVRTEEPERGDVGNRVAFLLAQLPLCEPDPKKRLASVCETTRALKASSQARGAERLEEIFDATLPGMMARLYRLALLAGAYNLVVTNVPGPQSTAYLLGAPLVESYPLVPLFADQNVGIALVSYDGGLFWGFNADWDGVPDLHALVVDLEASFAELCAAAGSPVSLPSS
ncbi:MAG: wax ester/triacylglycerol synthase family O-acyltransferase [Deltaproteobacteria bacterium]|nr:wax ester/triacylglycerol synthase family O-acyltransferase [Deltaproteobacteria bacterium]